MNKLLTLLAICISSIAFSQLPTRPTPSSINNVTVFLSGAQVNRTATVQLNSGEQIIRLTQLSPYIDPNSIQIKGSDEFTIVAVKHQINYEASNTLSRPVQLKVDSLDEMKFTLKMRQSLKRVYQSEKNLLLANHNIKGNNTLLVEDLEEMLDFQRKRMKEVEYKLLEINEEEKQLNEDIRRLQSQVSQFTQQQSFNSGELYITINANNKTITNLNLSYLVSQAGWFPVYDVRAKDINEPLDLVYRGQVYQSSGNDWSRVNLTLSTGNPNSGGQAPELDTWYLYLGEVYRRQDKNTDLRVLQGNLYKTEDNKEISKLSPAQDEGYYESEIEEINFSQNVKVQSGGINTEFNINIPYDIPSDGKTYNVEMQRSNVPATFQYLAIPKLDKDAFLIADITDWQQYNLLAGESNTYYQGTFVGKAFIDPANTDDTLSLSLGRDPSIVITRDRIKDYCKTTSLMGKKKTTKGFEIVIRNNKSKAIQITVQDQVPLSTTNEIEVTRDDVSGGKVNEETGEISWEMNINPGETKTLILKYTVKYPKKKIIPNL